MASQRHPCLSLRWWAATLLPLLTVAVLAPTGGVSAQDLSSGGGGGECPISLDDLRDVDYTEVKKSCGMVGEESGRPLRLLIVPSTG